MIFNFLCAIVFVTIFNLHVILFVGVFRLLRERLPGHNVLSWIITNIIFVLLMTGCYHLIGD